ncbi:MAG TPA: hemerythrin domain-containing protein [Lachnospiraceae bacterium]|nr:hemerythrin domain-containing protein [Lachnospiraceae bacterium]
MNSIDLMVEEHTYIIRLLKVVRQACLKVMHGEDICYEDFDLMIDFIRNYADAHHHGKEEKFLFKEMAERMGKLGENLVKHGMLVEHDWGRLFISELRAALDRTKSGDEDSKLDVIANAMGYVNHLGRHIAKEDSVIYNFARKELDSEVLAQVDKQSEDFEEEAKKQGVQAKYIGIVEELEKKYL